MTEFSKKLLWRISVPVLVVAVLAVGIHLFYLRVKDYASSIVMVRAELADWAASVQSFALVSSQYSGKGKTYIEILRNIIPEKDEFINLKKEFQFLASAENISLNFSFGGDHETQNPHFASVGFTLNLEGQSVSSISKFIDRLANFRYLTSLDGVTIIEKEDKVDGVIRGRVYYRK